MALRIEVRQRDDREPAIAEEARKFGLSSVEACRRSRLYFLSKSLSTEQVSRLCAFLLADPVTETARCTDLRRTDPLWQTPVQDSKAIEIALRPGVTNVRARELARGLVELGLPACRVATATRYEFEGQLDEADLHRLAGELLCNETIEHYVLGPISPQFEAATEASDQVECISLRGLDSDALLRLSKERLLSLDIYEMRTIQAFFDAAGREPTDVELETLAQTWSEHCVHKTFRSRIDFTWEDNDGSVRKQERIDGLLKQYIRAATEAVYPEWLHSAFVDDAGIIAFDGSNDLAFKVETHNHPSALEPFGGANTGVGGVVRDILGVSARPIATTDVLCFGPQDLPPDELPPGALHPQRVASGVVAGIGDYGNKLGLPTVNGAVIYDKGYTGNPLVFCGAVGLLPRGSHPTQPERGDRIVVLGGRTGRDGLHGATFSSAELSHDTSEVAGSAVQIGDPITEKGLIELIEAARDERLYSAITDCGAGGLSSAIGEMGEDLGVDVELREVPLKYPGLTPWEIWLSEAQERMVVAVPPQNVDRLQKLAVLWEVEMRDLGHFSGDGWLRVRYAGRPVAELPMNFLHGGLPQRTMKAVWRDPAIDDRGLAIGTEAWNRSPYADTDFNSLLTELLAHPSVASKEDIVRTYDHEVRGGTLVRPFTGPKMDGPSDAAVLKPLGTWQHEKAFALSVGINPLLGRLDPYAMAVSVIDEAVRNAVAVGADPKQIAILDNFCWGNPTLPDRLGALVRACQGCYDGAVAYRTPFISGKDSLYNEFDGKPIPGTLLVSAIGIVPDMRRTCTSHFKRAGNRIYLLGETRPELGGSLLYHHLGVAGGMPPAMPHSDGSGPLARYQALHQAIRAGLVRSCHDLSEGGLVVALAEMALAGRLGARVDAAGTVAIGEAGSESADLSIVEILFSESNGRLLLEVAPEHVTEFEAYFDGISLTALGSVTDEKRLIVRVPSGHGETQVIDIPVADLVKAWTRC